MTGGLNPVSNDDLLFPVHQSSAPAASQTENTGGKDPEALTRDPSGGLSVASETSVQPAEEEKDSWRVEVAARLERYRTRRKPQSPRYPSLLLPFDAPVRLAPSTSTSSTEAEDPGLWRAAKDLLSVKPESANQPERSGLSSDHRVRPLSPQSLNSRADESAKVLEFPRSAAIPAFDRHELAEPVMDRPRIVEAPEILPPPPALGGMLIEPAPREPVDEFGDGRANSASIGRRLAAALVDGSIIVTALGAFAAIFVRFIPIHEPQPLFAAALGTVAILLWCIYEFLLVIYTGSTPGLRAARLHLARFDGTPVNRRIRFWRVLASFLSAFSAGLGYIWGLLDRDGLCWHDRITRTCIELNQS